MSAGQEQTTLHVNEAGHHQFLLALGRINSGHVKAREMAGGAKPRAFQFFLEVHIRRCQLMVGVVGAQLIWVVAQLHGGHKSAISGVIAHAIQVRGGWTRSVAATTPVQSLHGVGHGVIADKVAEMDFSPHPLEGGVLHALHPNGTQLRIQRLSIRGRERMAAVQLDAGAALNLQVPISIGQPVEICSWAQVQRLHFIQTGQIILHIHSAGRT